MCLVPAIHHWGIIQVRPSRGMVLEVQMSHVAQILPRVFRKQHRRPCLWKICVSHPKTEVPLKASGSLSREELHLCHARVSVHWQRTDPLTPVLGAAEAGSQAGPPQSAALGAPSHCLDLSCSPAAAPSRGGKQWEQDLISPPSSLGLTPHPGLAWEQAAAAAFGPFLLRLTRNLPALLPAQLTCLAVHAWLCASLPGQAGLGFMHWEAERAKLPLDFRIRT